MLTYGAILIYLIILAYNYDISKKRRPNFGFHYAISCVLLIIVAAIRYRIGYDTINYMDTFRNAPTIQDIINGYDFSGDPLWFYIMGISKAIYNDFTVVQLFQSIIVNCAVFWFVRRHSPKPFIAILLYYTLLWWNLCFEAMREAIAVAFFLYALDGLLSGKGFKSYFLRVWPAIFAHTFGAVTLVFPFIKYLKLNKFTLIIFIGIIGLSFSVKDYLNEIVLMLEVVSDDAMAKGVKYLTSDTYGESGLSLMGIVSTVIGGILPCVSVIAILNRKANRGKNSLLPYVFICLCIVILRLQIPIFFRFLNYFEPLLIVAFTQAITVEKSKLMRQFASVSMFLMVFIRMYSLTSPDVDTPIPAYYRYVPYNTIFTKDFNRNSEIIFSH